MLSLGIRPMTLVMLAPCSTGIYSSAEEGALSEKERKSEKERAVTTLHSLGKKLRIVFNYAWL